MTKDVAARFERIEANLERISEEHLAFQHTVTGAVTVQQEQFAELTKNMAINSAAIAELTKNAAKNDAAIAELARLTASLERQWQAYLSTIHPKQ